MITRYSGYDEFEKELIAEKMKKELCLGPAPSVARYIIKQGMSADEAEDFMELMQYSSGKRASVRRLLVEK